jgi:hypothetical protein
VILPILDALAVLFFAVVFFSCVIPWPRNGRD